MRRTIQHTVPYLLAACCVWLCCEAFHPLVLGPAAAMETGAGAYAGGAEAYSGILRLHIVANSDSEQDQQVKLRVRDALLQRFSPTASLAEAEELLLQNGADVQEAIEAVLQEQGCGYGAQLRFGRMAFPERQYESAVYPAGQYEALKVELGAAQGQNWWCVLFPPLCLVDIAVTELPDTDELVFESDILAMLQ